MIFVVLFIHKKNRPFCVLTSGYYYIPTKVMFDALGFNYENGNIMFDLVRQPSLDNDLQGQVYFMKQRQYKRKEKKDEDIIIDP